MSILAKKEGAMRLIGYGLIFLGAVLSLIFDFVLLNSCLLPYITISIIIPWILFIISEKLQKELLMDNYRFWIFFLIFYTFGLYLLAIIFCTTQMTLFPFIFLTTSNLMAWICWHVSISIYKIRKRIFLISGTFYIVISLIFRIIPLKISIFPLILVFSGMIIIILAELKMKKKGLLNYI